MPQRMSSTPTLGLDAFESGDAETASLILIRREPAEPLTGSVTVPSDLAEPVIHIPRRLTERRCHDLIPGQPVSGGLEVVAVGDQIQRRRPGPFIKGTLTGHSQTRTATQTRRLQSADFNTGPTQGLLPVGIVDQLIHIRLGVAPDDFQK